MTTAATISAKLILDKSDYDSGLDSAETKAKTAAATIGSRLKSIGSSMQSVGNSMTLGITVPIVAGFGYAMNAAMESESAMAEVNAVIESTGGKAGVTADALTAQAEALQKVTKFEDDAILSGQSMLLTFTNIGSDVFPEATVAMLNMTEKFGSMESASTQLGKALNDPIAGISALSRVGVTFSEDQKAQIEGFMAVNDIASAQKVILDELSVEFGGLAEAAGQTTSGQLTILKNQLGNVAEELGVALLPLIIQLVPLITNLVTWFSNLSDGQKKNILVILGIVAAIGPLLTAIGTVISVVGTLTTFFGAAGAGGTALAAVGTFLSGTVLPVLGAALTTIGLPVIALIAAVGLLIYVIVKFGKDAATTLGNIQNIIGAVIQKAIWWLESLGGGFAGIGRAIQSVMNWFFKLRESISGLSLPSWLTPGSPTPLENGLVGIGQQLKNLSNTELPGFSAAVDLEPSALGTLALNSELQKDDSVNKGTSNEIDYDRLAKTMRDAFMQVSG